MSERQWLVKGLGLKGVLGSQIFKLQDIETGKIVGLRVETTNGYMFDVALDTLNKFGIKISDSWGIKRVKNIDGFYKTKLEHNKGLTVKAVGNIVTLYLYLDTTPETENYLEKIKQFYIKAGIATEEELINCNTDAKIAGYPLSIYFNDSYYSDFTQEELVKILKDKYDIVFDRDVCYAFTLFRKALEDTVRSYEDYDMIVQNKLEPVYKAIAELTYMVKRYEIDNLGNSRTEFDNFMTNNPYDLSEAVSYYDMGIEDSNYHCFKVELETLTSILNSIGNNSVDNEGACKIIEQAISDAKADLQETNSDIEREDIKAMLDLYTELATYYIN